MRRRTASRELIDAKNKFQVGEPFRRHSEPLPDDTGCDPFVSRGMRMRRFLMASAILSLFASGTPVAAASVIGATTIRITNLVPTWLQVGEVQAFAAGSGVNVALASNGATAAGSGNYSAQSTPDKAIDGLAPVLFPDIYHSDSAAASEFLEITLLAPTDLASLAIFGRTDSNSDRDLFGISIFGASGQTLFTGQLDNRALNGGGNTLTFDVGAPGVPEPTTWAMLIAGSGLTGAAMRRRAAFAA
ncbi:PEPxxWA-CTERM sorting domain-containing protein [Polymorphobacter fuscus]|nr:PEPxxWA-CTERM sorting domain-containing protein [Polymorphobacter fuscus]